MNPPKGAIKYVVLAICLPEAPDKSQTSAFIMEVLPELKKQGDDAKISVNVRDSLPDMTALGISVFGDEFADNNRYTYRTIHHRLQQGAAKFLVAYDKNDHPSKAWWKVW